MTTSELIVGLDIGTTKICAVVGEPDEHGGMDIVGIGASPSEGLCKGVVTYLEKAAQSIQRALKEAETMAGCEIRSVYVGIAGQHIQSLDSSGVVAVKEGGEVTNRDVERALDMAANVVRIPQDREFIHIIPQEYIVDDQKGIVNPLDMSGVRLEVKVHIVTGAVTSVQNIVRACHKSGLEVSGLVLESLASARSVLTNEERELGVALVDLGGGTSDIAIFVNNSVMYTGVLEMGGQYVTQDIAKTLSTSMAEAERLKIRHGVAKSDMVRPDELIEVNGVAGRKQSFERQLLAEICEARMEEILLKINAVLENSGYKDSAKRKTRIGAGVVLTGGASLMPGCQELAEQIFAVPTRIGSPLNVGGLRDMVNSPVYATAMGLLSFGAEQAGPKQRQRFRMRKEEGVFASILKWMKQWFSDIS